MKASNRVRQEIADREWELAEALRFAEEIGGAERVAKITAMAEAAKAEAKMPVKIWDATITLIDGARTAKLITQEEWKDLRALMGFGPDDVQKHSYPMIVGLCGFVKELGEKLVEMIGERN